MHPGSALEFNSRAFFLIGWDGLRAITQYHFVPREYRLISKTERIATAIAIRHSSSHRGQAHLISKTERIATAIAD